MPQVTVFVRKDDLEAWKAVEKKSQWIHDHLNNGVLAADATHGVSHVTVVPPDSIVRVDKRNPDVQFLIDAWESQLGPLHGKQAENRKYAQILIKRKDIGLERAVGAIKAYAAIKGQKYSPKIVDVQSLYRKWADLEDFYLRKKADDEDPDRELTQEELNKEFNL